MRIVNKNVEQVLQLSKSLGLYIINGRMKGDSLGRFTFCFAVGNSVVNYDITDMGQEQNQCLYGQATAPLASSP